MVECLVTEGSQETVRARKLGVSDALMHLRLRLSVVCGTLGLGLVRASR